MPKSSIEQRAPSAEVVEYALHLIGITDREALGEFELEKLGRAAREAQDPAHQLADRLLLELADRQVHGDRKRRAGFFPSPRLRAGLDEHPFADLADHPGLFRDRDELIGRDQPDARMVPTHEGLASDDATRVQADLRLVEQPQLIVDDRSMQRGFEIESIEGPQPRLGGVQLVVVAPALFGAVHRSVGAFE